MDKYDENAIKSAKDFKRCNCCGSMFVPYRPYQKYCTNECRKKVFRKKYYYKFKSTIQKKCKNCEKEFLTNNKKKLYCSSDCQKAYQVNYITHAESTKRRCDICDKVFETTHWSKKYCSHDCYLIAAQRRKDSANN